MPKVYVLAMNDMRYNAEQYALVACSESEEKLKGWLNEQLADKPWRDDTSDVTDIYGETRSWHKIFKKGSPLEWYNDYHMSMFGHGIRYIEFEEPQRDEVMRYLSGCNFIS